MRPLKVVAKAGLALMTVAIVGPWMPAAAAEDGGALNALIRAVGEADDADFQRDVLLGILDGLRGQKHLEMPASWTAVAAGLRESADAEVRELTQSLALIFDDPVAVQAVRAAIHDRYVPVEKRRAALGLLIERRPAGFGEDLRRLLDDPALRIDAIRGLASFADENSAKRLVANYAGFSPAEQQETIATLVSHRVYVKALLTELESGEILANDVSSFAARQILQFEDEELTSRLHAAWGKIRATPDDLRQRIDALQSKIEQQPLERGPPERVSLENGRAVFQKVCSQCHRLFGEGGTIGPDLTGSNRHNLFYVLENVLDPSAAVSKDYQMTTIVTVDGRVLSGIVQPLPRGVVAVQTPQERILMSTSEIEEQRLSPLSLMPNGLFDKLSLNEIRDLTRYLASGGLPPSAADE